ncbi:uncharacterized protein LOC135384748 [Ornithodoros turicata]|uniref:uncharacterized protein LOC135384748 n=1 Tax=Ornithodoros turicata TaxID=34597 RepID=UPI0031388073
MEPNRQTPERRLAQVTRKLLKSPDLAATYDTAIREYLLSGVAERVSHDAHNNDQAHIYYMPHHAVIREDRITTKVRIVFDASSHDDFTRSLNDNLDPGPNLNPSILSLLLNFRLHPIALVADVQKAFLQIAIRQEDRDALRFLWYSTPPTSDQPLPDVETWRMTRVTFGTAPSTFLLAATLRHHLRCVAEEHPAAIEQLTDATYVDDVITGAPNEEDACQTYRELQDIFAKASMTLQKWGSNSAKLREIFKNEPNAILINNTTKVLGVTWDQEKDVLSLPIKSLSQEYNQNPVSKRKALTLVAEIYDPLEETWKCQLAWDDNLLEDLLTKWQAWHTDLQRLNDIQLPRCYTPGASITNGAELHFFSDASPLAYGTVAYMRIVNDTGIVTTHLLTSKSRLAPLKTVTLARLELLGALISSRIAKFFQKNFKLPTTNHFWSDSTIVLQWIRGSATKPGQFVENRVREIRHNVGQNNWSYVPSSSNPADLLTRGITSQHLISSKLWWQGPSWLQQAPEAWPAHENTALTVAQSDDTLPDTPIVLTTLAPQESLIPIENFSDLNRLHRVTAWVIRFTENARRNTNRGPLSTEEIENAQCYWIRHVQASSFPVELDCLSRDQPIRTTSKISDLQPLIDSNRILRLGRRLSASQQAFSEQHPALILSYSHYAKLLITDAHHRVFHSGVRDTLVQLREEFWIIRARQRVKQILGRCITCRRNNSRASTEVQGQLPAGRITRSHPFQVIGVDFAGPLTLRQNRKYFTKAHIALFTCAVTRAVHIELCEDTSAVKFLQAFRRFTSRRGICSSVYSDNAKTFKTAAKELHEIRNVLRDPLVQDHSSARGIQWHFIVERAPWSGAFYERLICSVKNAIRKTLSRRLIDFAEMRTLLTEVEAMINSRPLTFVYSDDAVPVPLTPASMIIGRRLLSRPATNSTPSAEVLEDAAQSNKTMHAMWKRRDAYIDAVWERWQKEYLTELRSAHHSKTKGQCNVDVGDVVIIREPGVNRLLWKLGLVERTLPGSDGRVRVCLL